jgi:hypothetical protein
MIDIYVLDKNLEQIGIIDAYKSLIWANRYNKSGDCELYLEASISNYSLLAEGNYLMRQDDDMVCKIKKIEIDTNTEEGNFLIVTGYDVKSLLDQRVIWGTMVCDGNVETFIRSMVQQTVCTPALYGRQMQKANGDQLIFLGDQAGLTEVTTEQVSYKNVGEKIREYCQTFHWGYRVVLSIGKLWFQLYQGTDRSSEVIFSDAYENLSSTKYVKDKTNMGNVALVGGAGQGSERARNVFGFASGTDRYEIFVDAKDIARELSWEELTKVYPTTDQGGQGYISGSASAGYTYKMNYVNVQVVDSDQLTWLQTNFPGGTILTIDGNKYYQAYNATIALLQTDSPTNDSPAILQDIIYSVYLLNRGAENVAQYGEKTTFEGSVIPDVTFIYKQDYFMGDLVKVENEYGISANARIVEVVEVMDENGYSVEPKFEYMEVQ